MMPATASWRQCRPAPAGDEASLFARDLYRTMSATART